MAELPDVGGACSICGRQDFLPYRCHLCTRSLCDEHKKVHDCAIQESKSTTVPSTSNEARILCSLDSCRAHPGVKIVCEFCSKNFCLAHRFADQHECPDMPKKEESNSTTPATRPISTTAPIVIQKATNLTGATAVRADKIAQMRAKQAAERQGIPASFCHLVYVRPEDTTTSTLLAVHRDWMVGRATHQALQTLGLPAQKDDLMAVLVNEATNEPLTVSDAISKSCENAASLLVRYVTRQPTL